jgi:hypothetical protein
VFSAVYDLPSPSDGRTLRVLLAGWSLSGVITVQSGNALTILYTNSRNVFGVSSDKAQLSGACTKDQIVTNGDVKSKLNRYFNTACFATPSVIGADGIGTDFGNSGTGIASGPGQANVDASIRKSLALRWPREGTDLQIRFDFFNLLNHAQFADPDNSFSSPTFGVINKTSVNPRVGQVALKLIF